MKKRSRHDSVHHPAHYTAGRIEHIEYVEDRGWLQGYALGNVTKYIHRAGLKAGAEQITDLRKAAWYLDRYIKWLQRQAPPR